MAGTTGFQQFDGRWGRNARLAWDTIAARPARGIATKMCHVMDPAFIEEVTGSGPGDFAGDPDTVYIAFQRAIGACLLDQYLAENVLSMSARGYESQTARNATTGLQRIVLDEIEIDSPEAVVEHLERFVWPRRAKEIDELDPDAPARVAELIAGEVAAQERLGCDILKGPYGQFGCFPKLAYTRYGYENYFMAYALYPEVMEREFAQAAEASALSNRVAARAIVEGGLPPMIRLDHDMADSRGTLVDIQSLDRIWLPHFARAIEPLRDAGVRLLWHCDGNLMKLVPRLLEAGVSGFQGFQYEDGMDYQRIGRMRDRDGRELLIIAGVSVTTTLPFGTRRDVIDQLDWLVEHGPRQGLFLGASSSITPGTDRENIRTLIEGLRHYRENGRN